ncbi:hypothetical protein NL676_039810 [Syzygium grande]|nr:hypothetical protein NL676_039810 [Syzygium grande]
MAALCLRGLTLALAVFHLLWPHADARHPSYRWLAAQRRRPWGATPLVSIRLGDLQEATAKSPRNAMFVAFANSYDDGHGSGNTGALATTSPSPGAPFPGRP